MKKNGRDNSGIKRYFFCVILMSVIVGTLSTSCEDKKQKSKPKNIFNVPPVSNEQMVDDYINYTCTTNANGDYYEYVNDQYSTYTKTRD